MFSIGYYFFVSLTFNPVMNFDFLEDSKSTDPSSARVDFLSSSIFSSGEYSSMMLENCEIVDYAIFESKSSE